MVLPKANRIIVERNFKLDGIKDEKIKDALISALSSQKWGKIFADDMGYAYEDLTRDFYSGIISRGDYFTTTVHGKLITVNTQLISQVIDCEKCDLVLKHKKPSNPEICRSFVGAGAVNFDGTEKNGQFSIPENTEIHIKLLGKLVASNLYGTTCCSSKWARGLVDIVYFIISRKQVDVCRTIVERMKTIKNENGGLFFPCLITKICKACDIKPRTNKPIKPPQGIGQTAINHIKGVKGVNTSVQSLIPPQTVEDMSSPAEEGSESDSESEHEESLLYSYMRLNNNLKPKEGMKNVCLVLDINKILGCCFSKYKRKRELENPGPHLRPHCHEFVEFCFKNFPCVIFWTSMNSTNLDFAIGELKVHDILKKPGCSSCFVDWLCQDSCTKTSIRKSSFEDDYLQLKEFSRIKRLYPQLNINETNTLMVDDSPAKCILNPRYTCVFPEPYNHLNIHDRLLGPEGDLTTFLNGLPPESGSIREHIRINLPATFQKTDPALDPLIKDNIENQKVLWNLVESNSKKTGIDKIPDFMIPWARKEVSSATAKV